MAFEIRREPFPMITASAVGAQIPVMLDVADTQRQVVAIATNNVRPFGLTAATAVTPGDPVTVDIEGVIKVIAAASLGAGTEVGIASTNGTFGPVTGASGATKWAVGESVTAAAAGETFSLWVSPRQLSNLV